ncbi:thioredoxin family protein [Mycoplasmatota bacterium]|nr:thioredoxin family protein [Mycoplasmatota bacterium]
MSQVYMLTKPDCPNCQKLKMFLKFALNNKYENDIQMVDKVANGEEFLKMVKKYNVLTLPVLIHEDDVLINVGPSQTTQFLEKYIGKK